MSSSCNYLEPSRDRISKPPFPEAEPPVGTIRYLQPNKSLYDIPRTGSRSPILPISSVAQFSDLEVLNTQMFLVDTRTEMSHSDIEIARLEELEESGNGELEESRNRASRS